MEEARETDRRAVKKRWNERKNLCNRGGGAGRGGCGGTGKQCPNQAVRVLGAWYRGVTMLTPPPPSTRRGQLCYAGLTASVCCVPVVCLDCTALLSQQLNSRWLKKASIQSARDQENHTEESTQAADKTHKA